MDCDIDIDDVRQSRNIEQGQTFIAHDSAPWLSCKGIVLDLASFLPFEE
jgi:hypothetical protein